MPQPIDFQTEVAKTTAAERIQAIADRASLAAQQREAMEAEERRIHSETEVVQTPEAQSEHVDPELRRRTPYVQRRRKRNSASSEEQDPAPHRPAGDGEGERLDVTV